jgi:Fe-S-cluster-containing dehydrogenase component
MSTGGSGRFQADPRLCRDCRACTLACSLYHEGICQPSLARLAVTKDMAAYEFHIAICQHCDPPPCLAVCAADAMRLDDRGVVLIDDEACIRCGACASACPYEAVFHQATEDRYLKCDLCGDRVGGPLCVAICPAGALTLRDGRMAE